MIVKQPPVPAAPRGALRSAPTLRATAVTRPAVTGSVPGITGTVRALPVLRSR